MTGHWVVTHRAPVVLVRGLGSGDRLRAWGLKPLWSATGNGHVIDDRHLSDVLIRAELEQISVRAEGADVSADVSVEQRRQAARAFHATAAARAGEFLDEQQAAIRDYRRQADELCRCDAGAPVLPVLADLLGAVHLGHEHQERASS